MSKKNQQKKNELVEADEDFDEADAGEAEDEPEVAVAGSAEITDKRRTRGPRRVVYILGHSTLDDATEEVAIRTLQITSEIAMAGTSGPTGNSFDRSAAEKEVRARFEEETGSTAEFCSGPFYLVRDPSGATGHKRETVNMSVGKKYSFTGEIGSCIHKGWSCTANFTKNPDLVFLMYDKVVNAVEAGAKMKDGKQVNPQKPNPRYVPTNVVSNLKCANEGFNYPVEIIKSKSASA